RSWTGGIAVAQDPTGQEPAVREPGNRVDRIAEEAVARDVGPLVRLHFGRTTTAAGAPAAAGPLSLGRRRSGFRRLGPGLAGCASHRPDTNDEQHQNASHEHVLSASASALHPA